MKFYKNNNSFTDSTIRNNKLTAIHQSYISIRFFKNGTFYNSKNAAYINFKGYKSFYLNDEFYGYEDNFTKNSWRKFCKMQVFL